MPRLSALLILATLLYAAPAAASVLVETVEAIERGGCPERAPETTTLESALAAAHVARCWFAEGRNAAAAALTFDVDRAARDRDADLRVALDWFEELRARALLHTRRAGEAETALRDLIASPPGHETSRGVQARRSYYLALAVEAQGRSAEADDLYRTLLRQYPSSEYAGRVAPRLVDERWTPTRALEAGQRALDGRHYEAAEALFTLAACGAARCTPLEAVESGDATRAEAAYQLGWLLYRFRREYVARALPWLETVAGSRTPRAADAAHAYALAVDRQRRLAEGRRSWRSFAGQHGRDERADAADARVAWSLLEEMRYVDAADAWDAVARRAAGDDVGDARWWAGWAAYRAGNCARAIDAWSSLGTRAQLRYWRAVCAAEQGDTEAARAVWQAIRRDAPFDWYGLLSARRLGVPPVDASARVALAAAPRASDAALAAARAGLAAEARLLADRSGADDPDARYEIDADPMAWVRARAALGERETEVPTSRADAMAWQRAFPPFYRDAVSRFAGASGVPDALVWAIMQKESSYRTDALSRSDAMGLMQVIPQTALAIAARMEVTYADGELFEPRRAIRYGAWYLGALSETFGEQGPLVLAGYNAGPVATRAWMERGAGLPLDVFVEEIAFEQARDYVRRVTEILVGYTIAHGDETMLASPTLGGWLPETIEERWTGYVTF